MSEQPPDSDHHAASPLPRADGMPAQLALIGASTEEIVRTIDVVKEYRMGEDRLQVLKGVNLTIFKGEYISIMGPSGSGKSTLFNVIGGLDKPTSGKVYIDEVDIAQLDALRAGVAALPQDRLHLSDVQPASR